MLFGREISAYYIQLKLETARSGRILSGPAVINHLQAKFSHGDADWKNVHTLANLVHTERVDLIQFLIKFENAYNKAYGIVQTARRDIDMIQQFSNKVHVLYKQQITTARMLIFIVTHLIADD